MKRSQSKNSGARRAEKAAPKLSGKQKRTKLEEKRAAKKREVADEKERKKAVEREKILAAKRREGVLVEFDQLAPNNSYSGWPAFASRGYYIDIPFVCRYCGGDFVFTAKWQKWWYETVKARVWSRFNRCEACQLKLKAAKEAKKQEDARRTAKNKIRKLRAAGKLTPALEKGLLAAARKVAT